MGKNPTAKDKRPPEGIRINPKKEKGKKKGGQQKGNKKDK